MISIDTLAPTVAITLADSTLTKGETTTVTFTFSEVPTGFDLADVTVENGALSAFTVTADPLVYTATYTPTDDLEDATNMISVGTGYTDAAGNTGTAAASANYTIDTLAPSVTITSDVSAVKIGETATITFTFSDDPVGTFADEDIATTGGTLSPISGTADPLVYTAIFTPTPGTASGTASITVADGSYTDAAGDAGTAGTTPVISIDTLAPTVAITLADSTLTKGETTTVTFTFSEVPTGFDLADVTVENGALSAFTVTADPLVYTATYTPTDDLEDATNMISVGTGYTDAAGNTGTAAASANYSIDTLAPTVAITLADSTLTKGETTTVTFTFSEVPTGFDLADVTVENGALSAFTVTADPLVYTATYTPTDDLEDATNMISVGTGYTDAAGNTGTAAASANYTIDTLAPSVTITSNVSAVKIGETATITFTFSDDPVATFADEDIATTGGTLSPISGTADPLVYTAIFTPTPDTASGTASITVANGSYTDAAGDAGTAGTTPVISIDTLAPTVAITLADSTLTKGETTTVTFTFSEVPTGFDLSDVTVENGALSAFTVTADPLVYTATYTPTDDLEDATNMISVGTGYTDAAGNTGTAAASANYSIDTLAPTVAITLADSTLTKGETTTVTFTFSEVPTGFDLADVTVENGALSAFTVTADPLVYTATYTPTDDLEDATNMISVGTGYTDAAGNTGTAAASANYTIDTLAPSVTITSDVSAVKIGETATITFTFSDDPVGTFADEDIATTGGTLSPISGTADPLVYTAIFTPTPDTASGTASITVADGSYTDTAGDAGTAGTTPVISIDTLAPTVAITLADSTLTKGETTTVTFTFSEVPTGFDLADVTVENGALSAFTVTADPLVYTATYTPTDDLEDATNMISVGTGYTDAAGNTGTAAASANYTIDTLAPSVTITSDVSAVKIGETATITFTFSDDPVGTFADEDIATTGGTLSPISGTADPLVYTAIFTPTPDTASGTASITVADGSYTDTAGDAGTAGTTPVISIDTLAPTVAITLADSTLTKGETTTVTFTFSEVPTGFDLADVTVENGALSAFTVTADPLVYTATYTPTDDLEDATNMISVGTGYTDAAGNTGTAAASANYSYRHVGPERHHYQRCQRRQDRRDCDYYVHVQ